MKSYQDRILDLVRALPAVDIQNRLMSITDGDIALSMIYMSDGERHSILRHVPGEKARRVREELSRNEHVRILYSHYEIAASTVIRKLSGEKNVQSARRYFRPR